MEAIVSLNTALPKKQNVAKTLLPALRQAVPWHSFPLSPAELLQRDGLARELRSEWQRHCDARLEVRAEPSWVWGDACAPSLTEGPWVSLLTPLPPPPADFLSEELPFFHLRQAGCDGRWTGAKSYIPKPHSLVSSNNKKKATDFWKFPPPPTITEGKVNGCSETRELSNHWQCF